MRRNGTLDRLRRFVREKFTRVVLVTEGQAESAPADTTRIGRTRSRRVRRVSMPPSERFVWARVGLIIGLIGGLTLERVRLVVTGGRLSTELLAVISGKV